MGLCGDWGYTSKSARHEDERRAAESAGKSHTGHCSSKGRAPGDTFGAGSREPMNRRYNPASN